MTTTDPAQGFTDDEWKAIRRALATTPYAALTNPNPAKVNDAASLIRWFDALRDRLDDAASRHDATMAKLDRAEKVIDAGRLVFAAFGAPTVAAYAAAPATHDTARTAGTVRRAIHDAALRRAALDCLTDAGTSMTGYEVVGRVSAKIPSIVDPVHVGIALADLVESGDIECRDTGGESYLSRTFTTARRLDGTRAALEEAILLAVRDQGDRGADVKDIELWIAGSQPGRATTRAVLLDVIGGMVDDRRLTADPTWRKWTEPGPTESGQGRPALEEAVLQTVRTAGGRGASVEDIERWFGLDQRLVVHQVIVDLTAAGRIVKHPAPGVGG